MSGRKVLVWGLLVPACIGLAVWLFCEFEIISIQDFPSKALRAKGEITALVIASENYRADLGSYPSAQAKVFFAQLCGENRLGKRYLQRGRFRLSSLGEVLDPWGFIYQIELQNDELSVVSPGLEKHECLPSYERIFDQ
jgi:hypothetical protein